jgi:DNA-binding NarL/FixJ family response regulator
MGVAAKTEARKHLLLVEDDAALQKMLVRLLGGDYEIWTATTVAEALDILRRSGPSLDVILVDLGLPDGRGTDVVDAARKLGCHAGSLLFSGLEPKQAGYGAMVAAVDAFLVKPIDLDALRAGLDLATSRSRQRRAWAAGELPAQGESFLELEMVPALQRAGHLSTRQTEVLAGRIRGLSFEQIALELDLSVPTVKCHDLRARRQLGARSALDLFRVFREISSGNFTGAAESDAE